ncbi:amino acid ABC transporter permease [Candidatus Solincola tengchongensis]|uniref:amino acid ABC transporter permease n=1 Tax=Candidatus Solincola tengchongensis TaxID=2900693 RepID=UPI002579C8E5
MSAIDERWRKVVWVLGIVLSLGVLAFLVVFFLRFQAGKTFIDEFFNARTFRKSLPYVLKGLSLTVRLALISEVFILITGLLIAMARISRNPILRVGAVIYIDVIRGLPLLLQIFIVYYGLAYLGFKLDPFIAGVAALTICYAAYEAEIFRAGIESIHRGQMEAARSLGMGYLQAMRYVVLPQAIRNVIPPLSNEFIALLKDTSLLSVIALAEILRRGTEMMGKYYNVTPLVCAAIGYLIITLPLMRLVQYVTNRLSSGR